MRRSVLSVAVTGVVLSLAAAGPGFSQINTNGFAFAPIQRATFNLAEAYPATSGTYTGISPEPISPNGCWTTGPVAGASGQQQSQNPLQGQNGGQVGGTPMVVAPTLADRCNTTLQPTLFNAIPSFAQCMFSVAGVLCLPTTGSPPRLNVNVFAVAGPGDTSCYVQMAKLTKTIPGSIKCPEVYGTPPVDANGQFTGQPAVTYCQFGATPTGIRTWWSLSYDMPGTKITLDVVVVCQHFDAAAGVTHPTIHDDRYTWCVVATPDTLPVVINLEHTNTIGTTEIPCIVNEQAYCDLMAASGLIELANASGNLNDRFNAIQTFEALLNQYVVFTDFVDPTGMFPGPVDPATNMVTYQPPSDRGTIPGMLPGGLTSVGIIDSFEHPCVCKLLVDVEQIAKDWGVAQ